MENLFYLVIKVSSFIIAKIILSTPESNAVIHAGHTYNPAPPYMSDRADYTVPPNFLESLSKQSNKTISTFNLIFWLLDHLLLKSKIFQVPYVKHHLWSMMLTTYLVIWLQTLRGLPCICQIPWATSNPANQLPSYESDTNVQAQSSLFCLSTGHSPAEIKHNQVVVKKENTGEEGSKQSKSNYTVATETLKPGFGKVKHFVLRGMDGK